VESEKKEIGEKVAQIESRLKTIQTEKAEVEDQLKASNIEVERKESELQMLKADLVRLAETSASAEKLEEVMKEQQERISALQVEVDQLASAKSSIELEKQEICMSAAQMESELNKVQIDREEVISKLRASEAEVEVKEKELQKTRADLVHLTETSVSAEKLEEVMKEQQERISALKVEVDQLASAKSLIELEKQEICKSAAQIESELQKVQTESEEVIGKLRASEAEAELKEKELQKLKADFVHLTETSVSTEKLEEVMKEHQEKVGVLQGEVDQLTSAKSYIDLEKQEISETAARMESEFKKVQIEREEVIGKLRASEAEVEVKVKELQKLKADLVHLAETSVSSEKLEAIMKEQQDKIISLQSDVDQLTAAKSLIEREKQEIEETTAQIKSQLTKVLAEREELESHLTGCKTEVEMKENELEKLKAETSESRVNLEHIMKEQRERICSLEGEVDQLASTHSSLLQSIGRKSDETETLKKELEVLKLESGKIESLKKRLETEQTSNQQREAELRSQVSNVLKTLFCGPDIPNLGTLTEDLLAHTSLDQLLLLLQTYLLF
jgi:chromosome segregation ATPase